MNKSLTPQEVSDLLSATRTLSRYDKLMIWATAIASYPRQLTMFHGLEYIAPHDYCSIRWSGSTIFDLGHNEPVLREAGLTSNDIRENLKFFELDSSELHFLSCDCLGEVPNDVVANRMAQLAIMKPGEFAAKCPQPVNAGPLRLRRTADYFQTS